MVVVNQKSPLDPPGQHYRCASAHFVFDQHAMMEYALRFEATVFRLVGGILLLWKPE